MIRFTTPYLVYKIKPFWIFFDKLAQGTFALIGILIMLLANYWQISLAMLLNLSCFIILVLIISSRLYDIRRLEKKVYKGKTVLKMEEVGDWWKRYKSTVNEH